MRLDHAATAPTPPATAVPADPFPVAPAVVSGRVPVRASVGAAVPGGPGRADGAGGEERGRPLVVTRDAELLDEVVRLAAAGCCEVDVAPDAVGARPYWTAAPLVVIGLDAAGSCLRARLPRRRNAVVAFVSGSSGSSASAGSAGSYGPELDEERAWDAADALGADHAAALPAASSWLARRLAGEQTSTGRVIAVAGGRGGAGASVLATALAVTAARAGHRAMLIDADPLGGGLDLMLGWETTGGVRWPALAGAQGRLNVAELYRELPGRDRFVVVSWDRGDELAVPPEAMDAALDAGCRGSDLVVVDLPRQPDEAAVRAAQLADPVLLVVPSDIRGCASAARVAACLGPHCRSLSVVARGPAPGGLRAAEVARALGLPLAGELSPEPHLDAALERSEAPAGTGRGPLAELCRRLLDDLGLAASGPAHRTGA
jgi:secretion/DNA translocation related CpaE-like protein